MIFSRFSIRIFFLSALTLLALVGCDNDDNLPTEAPEWRSENLPRFDNKTPEGAPSLQSPLGNAAASSKGTPSSGSPTPTAPDPRFVGAYAGVLPCADCEGIRTILMLTADGRFTLTEIYLRNGEQPQLPNQGQWALSGDGKYLALHSDKAQPNDPKLCFGIIDPLTIEKYDISCQPIPPSEIDYTLKKALD